LASESPLSSDVGAAGEQVCLLSEAKILYFYYKTKNLGSVLNLLLMKASNQTVDYSGRIIHFGLDYHKKSWAIQTLDGKVSGRPYTITNPTAEELHRRLHLMFPNATFQGVYEAGFGGYGLLRDLKKLQIELQAVHPADVPQTDKDRQRKTDPSDALRLAKLMSYVITAERL